VAHEPIETFSHRLRLRCYRIVTCGGIILPASVLTWGTIGRVMLMLGAVAVDAGQLPRPGAVVRQTPVPWPHHEQQPGTTQNSVKPTKTFHAVFMAHLLVSFWYLDKGGSGEPLGGFGSQSRSPITIIGEITSQ
jgi:hypothetical protein